MPLIICIIYFFISLMNLNHTYKPIGDIHVCLVPVTVGVSILLNNTFKHEIHKVKKDISGNYIIIDITIERERITIANIYGPNRERRKLISRDQNSKSGSMGRFFTNQLLVCSDQGQDGGGWGGGGGNAQKSEVRI